MSTNGLALGKHGQAVLESCRFEDVLPIWQTHLWPGRISKIEPNSAMKWLGGIDLELMNAPAAFWWLRLDARVIGVLSGHFGGLIEVGGRSGVRSYRTRGLYVDPEFRDLGCANALMKAAFAEARRNRCEVAWTFPRKAAMPAYEKMGFNMVGQWIGENDPGAGEFGPNCFALANLLHF